MEKYLIYALLDPRTKCIRYVGKSSSGLQRPKAHGYPSRVSTSRTHRGNWIRSLLEQGLMYEIVILETLSSGDLLEEAERRWIAQCRNDGCNLTNATDGGEGAPGRKCADETRKKIGAANAARLNTPEARAKGAASRKGKKLSPERAEKLAESNRGRKRSPEFSRRLSERRKGKRASDAQREKMRLAHIGKEQTAETRAKRSKALKGRVVSEDHRRKLSESGKGHTVSQETRDKISASLRARKALRENG